MSRSIANVAIPEISKTPELIEALQDAFWDWYGLNGNIIEDGGTGDVYALLLTLNAACWNAPSSNFSKPTAEE